MNDGARVFLGLIALASLVQVSFLAWAAVTGYRAYRGLGNLERRVGPRHRPAIEAVRRTRENLSGIARIAARQRRLLRQVGQESSRDWRDLAVHLGRVMPGGNRRSSVTG